MAGPLEGGGGGSGRDFADSVGSSCLGGGGGGPTRDVLSPADELVIGPLFPPGGGGSGLPACELRLALLAADLPCSGDE